VRSDAGEYQRLVAAVIECASDVEGELAWVKQQHAGQSRFLLSKGETALFEWVSDMAGNEQVTVAWCRRRH